MKLSILHEAYITGPYGYPTSAAWRSQSHTGPEYRYPDVKYHKFRKDNHNDSQSTLGLKKNKIIKNKKKKKR